MTRFSQKGTRVAPQIFTEARDKDVGPDRRNVLWSPENVLIDTVARLQWDLADMKAESQFLRTPGVPTVVPTPRHVVFTTKIPRFAGTTSWEQYRQVFDAIVLSNGWDDATAALQLLSHLEGDALDVALLVPVLRRASRVGLVDSGCQRIMVRRAYRRQFEKTTRTAGEDPSIFAIALETLAVKAFGNMGQTARLRLIQDRFIAGYSCCELRRYLDSVPPETPIRDVVDRCRVWESHADPETLCRIRWRFFFLDCWRVQLLRHRSQLWFRSLRWWKDCYSIWWQRLRCDSLFRWWRPNRRDWRRYSDLCGGAAGSSATASTGIIPA